jgi:hypothetical protein
VGDNVAGIASFGDDADFFLAIGQVVCQIDSAVAVPDQFVDVGRSSGKMGFIHQRHGSLAETDHHFHGAVM